MFLGVHHIPTTFTELLDELRKYGNAQQLAREELTGLIIPDTWTATNGTVYDDPMRIVDVKWYEAEDGRTVLGAKCQRVYVGADAVQFDAIETVVQCDSQTEATVQEGMGYYGWAAVYDTTKAYAVNAYCSYEGVAYKCTTAIPTGGEAWNPDHWTVQSSRVNSALVLLNGASGLSDGDPLPYSGYLGIYKNAIKSKAVFNTYGGFSEWKDSGLRQYLNSSEAAGQWWHATHIGDVAPATASSVRGYLAGCSQDLLNALSDGNGGFRKIKVPCMGAVSANYHTYDVMFISSATEVYGSTRSGDGTLDVYWKMAADKAASPSTTSPSDNANIINTLRIAYKVNKKTDYGQPALRTPSAVERINSLPPNGKIGNDPATAITNFAAACVIYN